MYEPDREKIALMIEQAKYEYNVMPFVLKNPRATYKRMMNKVFKEEIGETLEVYIDNIIVKSNEEGLHDQHFSQVFQRVRQYNMRLNP